MKILTSIIIVISTFFTLKVFAQCTPDPSMTVPGLKPVTDSLPCIVQSTPYDATIYIKNFTSLAGFAIDSLIIDSVTNLPCGIFYIPNKKSASYASNEGGCINLYGKTSDPVGQYQLGLYVRVYATPNIPFLEGVSTPLSTFATLIGQDYRYWVRVKTPVASCPAVDTNSTSIANLISTCNVKNTKRPTLKIDTVNVYNVAENINQIRFSYKITNPDTLPFTIKLSTDTLSSTATPGSDFTFTTVVRSFPGIYSENVNIINDLVVESLETAKLKLSSVAGPVLLLDSSVTIQINDDDVFNITMNSAGYAIPEDSSSARFAVKLTAFYPLPTSVKVSRTSGDATPSSDFSFNDSVLVIPANDTNLHFLNVTIFEDAFVEANEQAIFTLSNITNGAIPAISAFNLVIVDNDTAGTGISSAADHFLKIYPNPFVDDLYLDAVADIQSITIANLQGQLFYTKIFADSIPQTIVNTASWPADLYILQVKTSNNKSTFYRLMKL